MTKLFLAGLSYFIIFTVNAMDAAEYVKRADLKRGLGNVEHSFNVTVTNANSDKKEVFKVYFKDNNSTLTDQTEPEKSRGRKMLMKDYDIWLFTPNIKKPVRISLEQKLTGEVSNGDIAKTNYAQDYDATILGTIDSEKGKVVRLELKAKNNKVTYGRIEYFLLQKDATPLEAIFFAVSGKPLKRAKFMDFKKIDGEMRATKMVIQDFVQKDKESTLVFEGHKKEKLDVSMFNKDSLDF